MNKKVYILRGIVDNPETGYITIDLKRASLNKESVKEYKKWLQGAEGSDYLSYDIVECDLI